MRRKTNREREARKLRNKAKNNPKGFRKDIFQTVREVVSAQVQLEENAKNLGIIQGGSDEEDKEDSARN